jgi:hypothetical protein
MLSRVAVVLIVILCALVAMCMYRRSKGGAVNTYASPHPPTYVLPQQWGKEGLGNCTFQTSATLATVNQPVVTNITFGDECNSNIMGMTLEHVVMDYSHMGDDGVHKWKGKKRVNGTKTEFELQVAPGSHSNMRMKAYYLGVMRDTSKIVRIPPKEV